MRASHDTGSWRGEGKLMSQTKRALVGALVAAMSALVVLMATPAQGDGGDGKGASKGRERATVTDKADDRSAPDRAARARVAASPSTTAALTAIQTRIAKY